MTIAASVFLSCNVFSSTRQLNPFCDSALNASDFVSDNCEPCPNNGQCYQGKLECVRGYRKHRNSCVEDGDINQTAKKLECSRSWHNRVFANLMLNICAVELGRSGFRRMIYGVS